MTQSKTWIVPAAAAALIIGHVGYKPKLTAEGFPFPPTYTVLAADQTQSQQSPAQSEENADESAKMGKESGTQAGGEANTPESDTKKVDQPPRQNPSTGN